MSEVPLNRGPGSSGWPWRLGFGVQGQGFRFGVQGSISLWLNARAPYHGSGSSGQLRGDPLLSSLSIWERPHLETAGRPAALLSGTPPAEGGRERERGREGERESEREMGGREIATDRDRDRERERERETTPPAEGDLH